MRKIRSALIILATGTWLGGCKFDPLNLDQDQGHVGVPITDSSDPGFLELTSDDHAISSWFGYSIEGRESSGSRRMVFFHELEDGVRQNLGALGIDGGSGSVNEREAAYAISEDGRTLLYLHTLPESDSEKPVGLYRCVHESGDELIVPGAHSVWVYCPLLYSVPRNTLLYVRRTGMDSLFAPDALEVARFRNTEGEDKPLMLWGGNEIHQAAFDGDLARASETRDEASLDDRTSLGLTPLHIAILRGENGLARSLIECGADVDGAFVGDASTASIPALSLAVLFRTDDESIDLLLEAGADVDEAGGTALHLALEVHDYGQPLPFAPVFLGVPSDLLGLAAFFQAQAAAEVPFDGLPRIEKLLAAGANPEIRDPQGNPALHHAVELNDLEATELLLQYGAHPDARGREGARPLHFAKTNEIAELLLAYGASADARNDAGELPGILRK